MNTLVVWLLVIAITCIAILVAAGKTLIFLAKVVLAWKFITGHIHF